MNINIRESVLKDFLPRFAGSVEILHDTALKNADSIHKTDRLNELGLSVHDIKVLPDLIAYSADKDYLFMIDIHDDTKKRGFITQARHATLKKLTKRCKAHPVFIGALVSRKSYTKYTEDFDWGTHAWFAEEPAHMMHFSDNKFLKPYHMTSSG